ncbi:MAG: T9SS type A sorting domain-containing protein [Krumholzibacteria bacterium]|nr:T9SS type A sorting domain-containing protein [Candidatus Krumholzibacteria bacterium]
MKRIAIITSILFAAGTAGADTFRPTPYFADGRVDALTRDVTNAQLDRDLFGQPWATVVVGNIDVYATFPYLEARYFQVVSDPAWNRLLCGETGRGVVAVDGRGTEFGPLRAPRGLAAGSDGRVYVADTGNNRVLVFRAVTEFDRIALVPVAEITDLHAPYDVAWSDGGTPFVPGDDRLYVANTGRNEIRRYDLGDGTPRLAAAMGALGSGDGHFAGPLALAVGHREGAGTADVYVADAHNRRLVHLRDGEAGLGWVAARSHDLGTVTSLATDHWGAVYAAAPETRRLVKCTADLEPVAEDKSGLARPRGVHVPFVTVTDHRDGTTNRAGQGRALVVEQWDGNHGLRMVELGVELLDAVPAAGSEAGVAFTLTDCARVVAEIVDPNGGRVVARHDAGLLPAGRQRLVFAPGDDLDGWDAGRYRLRLRAESTYEGIAPARLELAADLAPGGVPAARLALLGNAPNPFNPETSISFTIPDGPGGEHALRIYDTRGRLVRSLGSGHVGPGLQQAVWDGRDDGGRAAGSGVYFYRLEYAGRSLTGKMVLVK